MTNGKNDIQSFIAEGFCPHCGKRMNLSIPNEWWEPIACQGCKRPISMNDLDKAASAVFEKIATSSKRMSRLEAMSRRTSEMREAEKGLASKLLNIGNRLLLQAPISHIRKRLSRYGKQILLLNSTRYRFSPWQRCLQFNLSPVERASIRERGLTFSYRKDGSFHASCNDSDTAGFIGEYIAYEQLSAAHDLRYPFLDNARCCHNLFLPQHKTDAWGIKGEIDIAILTQSVAIICEVKRWHAEISYRPHLQTINVKRPDEEASTLDGYKEDDKPLEQIAARVKDFNALGYYPENRVLQAVVFVNPIAFDSPIDSFVDSLLVTCCYEKQEGPFLDALNAEIAKYDPLFEQSEVDEIATEIQARYGDPEGIVAKSNRDAYARYRRISNTSDRQPNSANARSDSGKAPHLPKQKRHKARSKSRIKRKSFRENQSQSKSFKRRRQDLDWTDLTGEL